MAMFVRLLILLILAVAIEAPIAQSPRLHQALTQMIDAERAFAARALVVGWKQAFLEYFADDRECGCFSSTPELVDKIRYYLSFDDVRQRVASAGRRRVVESGHSVDCRAHTVLDFVKRQRHPARNR